jgi:hypothetical protein
MARYAETCWEIKQKEETSKSSEFWLSCTRLHKRQNSIQVGRRRLLRRSKHTLKLYIILSFHNNSMQLHLLLPPVGCVNVQLVTSVSETVSFSIIRCDIWWERERRESGMRVVRGTTFRGRARTHFFSSSDGFQAVPALPSGDIQVCEMISLQRSEELKFSDVELSRIEQRTWAGASLCMIGVHFDINDGKSALERRFNLTLSGLQQSHIWMSSYRGQHVKQTVQRQIWAQTQHLLYDLGKLWKTSIELAGRGTFRLQIYFYLAVQL